MPQLFYRWSDFMNDIATIEKIVPEIASLIEKRYEILKYISYNQPIGRRTLSSALALKERNVRDEVNILRNQNLLEINNMGMNITDDGRKTLDEIHPTYISLRGIPRLEENLKDQLNIKNVIIVPGNSKEDDIVTKEMGKRSIEILKNNLREKDIIGITGGSTMAKIAKEASSDRVKRDILVIPARGGLGKDLNTQSNSIAAKLAENLGGNYRLLYIPDNLEKEAMEYILKNKEINESINLIQSMNTLIFGIGRADTMAKRRNLSEEEIDYLLKNGSVAEAFGHFFNIEGKEIWEYKTIGLSLERFKSLKNLIGVAGGEEKAEAILAISSLNKDMTLVTDESCAKRILKIRGKF